MPWHYASAWMPFHQVICRACGLQKPYETEKVARRSRGEINAAGSLVRFVVEECFCTEAICQCEAVPA